MTTMEGKDHGARSRSLGTEAGESPALQPMLKSTRQRWTTEEATEMPPDETLLNRVRSAIGESHRVEEKKMFGGIAFMVEGKMCVTVGRGRIMCRIDPS